MSRFTLLTAFALLSLVACEGGDDWNGVAYPDASNLLEHQELGVFATLEDCRQAALSYLESTDALESGDYECGRDCESKGYGVMVCEETRR